MYKLTEGITNDNLREILEAHVANAYSLKQMIEEDYRIHRYSADQQAPLWNEWCSEWTKKVSAHLDSVIESKIVVNQFNNTKPAPYGIAGENAKWCNTNNYIDSKIDFLIELSKKIENMYNSKNINISVEGGSTIDGGIVAVQAEGDVQVLKHKSDYKNLYEKIGEWLLNHVTQIIIGIIIVALASFFGLN